MDGTGKMVAVGVTSMTAGLLLAMALPFLVLEDPGEAGTAWTSTICGGFLVAMMGAILLLTGLFRLQSAKRAGDQLQASPPPVGGCPHRTAMTTPPTALSPGDGAPEDRPPDRANGRTSMPDGVANRNR